jgi:hypothetical protein
MPTEPPPPVDPGLTIFLRRHRRGAFGEVWLARNALGAFRAVKLVFRANFLTDPAEYARELNGVRHFEPSPAPIPA